MLNEILYRQDREKSIEKIGYEKSDLKESGTNLNSRIEHLQEELEDSATKIKDLQRIMEEKENDSQVECFLINIFVFILVCCKNSCFCVVRFQTKQKIFYDKNL